MKYSNSINFYKFFKLNLQGNIDFSDLDLYDIKEEIKEIHNTYLEKFELSELDENNLKKWNFAEALEILKTCLNATDSDFNDLEFYEFFDLIEEIENNSGDDEFYLNSLPSGECRIIHSDVIDQIWTDSLIELVKDCYDLSDVPDFVAIDWEQTAGNLKVDGLGHHFGSYDGEEYTSGSYHIFRTN